MKFKSRGDLLFKVILYGVCVLLLFVLYQEITINKIDINTYIAGFVILLLIGFILWILHGTNYELNDKELIYRLAFIKGTIPLVEIQEIIVGKTMWAGYKPATARNGIIIIYNKVDKIYISPDSNDSFVKQLKKLKSEVKITYKTY